MFYTSYFPSLYVEILYLKNGMFFSFYSSATMKVHHLPNIWRYKIDRSLSLLLIVAGFWSAQ